eukprot:4043135-Pleurochrysis_carterae.AAC.2
MLPCVCSSPTSALAVAADRRAASHAAPRASRCRCARAFDLETEVARRACSAAGESNAWHATSASSAHAATSLFSLSSLSSFSSFSSLCLFCLFCSFRSTSSPSLRWAACNLRAAAGSPPRAGAAHVDESARRAARHA